MNEALRCWQGVCLHMYSDGRTFDANAPNIKMQCDNVHVTGHEKFIIYRFEVCALSLGITGAASVAVGAAAAAIVAAIDAVVLHNVTVGCNEPSESIVVH